jgi:hypothetical protein
MIRKNCGPQKVEAFFSALLANGTISFGWFLSGKTYERLGADGVISSEKATTPVFMLGKCTAFVLPSSDSAGFPRF